MQQLSVERMSKSKVSRLATSLDQIVEDSPTRPLDGAAHPYLVLDALEVKCREGAAPLLDEAGSEILAFTGFFEEHWRQRECDG